MMLTSRDILTMLRFITVCLEMLRLRAAYLDMTTELNQLLEESRRRWNVIYQGYIRGIPEGI